MEQVEAIPEGEWNGFCGIYSTDQESDFMSQLFGNNSSVPNDSSSGVSIYETPSHFYPSHEPNMISIVSGAEPNNFYNFSSRGGSGGIVSNSGCSSSSIFFPTSSHESSYFLPGGDSSSSSHHQFLAMNDSSCMSIDFFVGKDRNIGNVMEESGGSMEDSGEEDKVVPVLVPEQFPKEEKSIITKRSRVSGDVQKKRNVKPKKNQKVVDSSDDENKVVAVLNRQTSGSCCSEDESKPSALNLNGKSRASRGSATDPQSLYARKRRERINERLRMLQNLVPNGTKVDISTMLEEAVQYVKFLQLQIKLLSSDDMWMYAPIAYNGMDLGLDRTTPFPRG